MIFKKINVLGYDCVGYIDKQYAGYKAAKKYADAQDRATEIKARVPVDGATEDWSNKSTKDLMQAYDDYTAMIFGVRRTSVPDLRSDFRWRLTLYPVIAIERSTQMRQRIWQGLEHYLLKIMK